MSLFQTALLRWLQPFSVMPLLSEYKHSYWGINISVGANFPSRAVDSRYLRLCFRLIYILITEVKISQTADVGFAEGDTPLLSDVAVDCI